MTLFSEKGLFYSALTVGIVVLANAFGNQIKAAISPRKSEDELIRKYLLNENPLYGYNRPKLWIHSIYEYNARKWKSFGSRSSTDLNQDYLHATIKSIIQHCGDSFHVCLIDDDSFSQLLPGWKTDIASLPEPQRHQVREQAMLELLYIYGGMFVPNGFVCIRDLFPLYVSGIEQGKAFICETPNHFCNMNSSASCVPLFTSDTKFMGAPKRCPIIKDMIDYISQRNANGHVNAENDFFGYSSKWSNHEAQREFVTVIDGSYIGVKSVSGKPILIEDLLGEDPLEIDTEKCHGICIPSENLLKRSAYNWFCVMPIQSILSSHMAIVPFFEKALHRNNNKKDSVVREKSVVSI